MMLNEKKVLVLLLSVSFFFIIGGTIGGSIDWSDGTEQVDVFAKNPTIEIGVKFWL
jgi:hypothetical protein